MKSQHLKHLLELNLAMIFISTSGALGRYISIAPPLTIWWRSVFAILFLGLFCWKKNISLKFNFYKDGGPFISAGILMGAHWITYFYALQLSNVAIGMLSLFTYPVITAFLEPFILKTKFNPTHILLGFLVLIGIYFLAPELNLENNQTKGVLFGLLSSVLYALRNILLKNQVTKHHGSTLMFYQVVVITFCLIPVLWMYPTENLKAQIPAILTLALLTTTIGHTLFIISFKHFSISTASIMSSIQPIYGILIGFLFLGEVPSWNTLIGGTLILTTVVIESVRSSK